MRAVILGGSGNFGARICRALLTDPGIEVISASRHAGAQAATGRLQTTALDMNGGQFAAELRALRPDLVIHCIGPFQGQDYRVVQAALQAGAHYLDLADGREFVTGFVRANDKEAGAADRLAISGASTLPALSSAVLDALTTHLSTLEAIEIAIAPGQRAPRGTATIESVFSYVGRPFLWLQQGTWVKAHGWQELKRMKFDFGWRWAAACDVPDLELLPERYAGVRTVEFRAALELGVQHWALWLLAALRRAGIALPIERWGATLNRAASLMDRFGTACGGMRVRALGSAADGSPRAVTWQLTAPAGHGPEIPCMAAILLSRRLAAHALRQRGAHACMGFLTLEDFAAEFARWDMSTRIEEGSA